MKTQAIVIIHTCFAYLFIAFSASAQNAPGLEASDPHWGRAPTVGARAHSSPVDRSQAANYPPTSEVSALLRNTGQKVIKSVTRQRSIAHNGKCKFSRNAAKIIGQSRGAISC